MSVITQDHIEEFKVDGVTVIENMLSKKEIDTARAAFHQQLHKMGIDHQAILAGEVEPDQDFRIKSPVAKIFYAKWKLAVTLHPNVQNSFSTLIAATFADSTTKDFEHPFGRSDGVFPMIDRVCWRLPDHIRAEGGLSLHLDRNPIDPYLTNSPKGKLTKWRPIQGFITLTDHYGGESGGLKVVKGFHREIDGYFTPSQAGSGGGEFYRLPHRHSLNSRLEPINAPAGSLVVWDNRLPHATCQLLTSMDSREVVYVSYLPKVGINLEYQQLQRQAIEANCAPPAFLTSCDPKEKMDRDWQLSDLSEFQKKLLGF